MLGIIYWVGFLRRSQNIFFAYSKLGGKKLLNNLLSPLIGMSIYIDEQLNINQFVINYSIRHGYCDLKMLICFLMIFFQWLLIVTYISAFFHGSSWP